MNDVQLFNFQQTEVRVIDRDGEPWFVATDVARVLDYSTTAAMTRTIDDSEKGVQSLHTLGGSQEMTVISEAGLYEVIIKSRVPSARAFKKWVTKEVLPSIRKTGSYRGRSVQVLSDEQIVAQALQITTKKVEELEARNAVLEPKADAWDEFLDSDGTYSMDHAARIIGIGRNRLFQELRDAGVLISIPGERWNTPYQKYMHHFMVRASTYTSSDGERTATYTTKVRPSGLDFISRKLERGMAA